MEEAALQWIQGRLLRDNIRRIAATLVTRFNCTVARFLAVQNSSIGDLVTH